MKSWKGSYDIVKRVMKDFRDFSKVGSLTSTYGKLKKYITGASNKEKAQIIWLTRSASGGFK